MGICLGVCDDILGLFDQLVDLAGLRLVLGNERGHKPVLIFQDPTLAKTLDDRVGRRALPAQLLQTQLRKLRRQFLRYQQAEIVYSLSHKKLLELASDAGAIYRFDSTVLINREIFDAYLERFHEPARKITVEEVEDE